MARATDNSTINIVQVIYCLVAEENGCQSHIQMQSGQELNPRPLNCKFNTPTTMPPSHAVTVYLVILSMSTAFGVHQLSMRIREVTVAQFAVEASGRSSVITTFFNVLQTCNHSFCSLLYPVQVSYQLQHITIHDRIAITKRQMATYHERTRTIKNIRRRQ